MSSFFSSGSEAVDKMGQINISGDVTPRIWYQQIRTEKGKPYYLAVNILADIVYWYRPVEIRDERTGNVIGWKKKFALDMLQRSYKQMMKNFEENRKTIQRALETLENYGLIKRRFRTLVMEDGTTIPNVMFIQLYPEKVYEITYPSEDKVQTDQDGFSSTGNSGRIVQIIEEEPEGKLEAENCGTELPDTDCTARKPEKEADKNGENQCQGGMDKFDHTPGQICPHPWTDLTIPLDRSDHTPGQIYPYPRTDLSTPLDRSVHTNTENTTGISAKISSQINGYRNYSIYPSNQPGLAEDGYGRLIHNHEPDANETAGAYMQLIKKNIQYDANMKLLRGQDVEMFEELYMVICDVVCVPREKIRVGREDMPYALVKSRFLKLNQEHLLYVIECMKKTVTKISNIRAYMITSLYNAPTTIEHFYNQEANRDFYMDTLTEMNEQV